MLFSLEALKAKHGDALILHYGSAAKPRLMLIDGGPPTVFNQVLKARLAKLHKTKKLVNPETGQLDIPLAMVSHIDQDHVHGMMMLFGFMEERGPNNPYRIARLWHNSFKSIVGTETVPASVQRRLGGAPTQQSRAVVASVPEANKLTSRAQSVGVPINDGPGTLITGGGEKRKIDGVEFTILGPREAQVQLLKDEWKKEIDAPGVVPASRLDESAWNLSSIVVIAKLGGKRMLLTGDARGDYVLEALEKAKQFKKGRVHFDLLKIPHHGSDRNVSTEFFRRVTADHYVFSGDGNHGNPETATLTMLSEARGTDAYDVWFTYKTGLEGLGPKMTAYEKALKAAKRPVTTHYASDAKKALFVDLGDQKVTW